MARSGIIDIAAVEACLKQTQRNFDDINATLTVQRTPPSDEVISNLIAGYVQVNSYLKNDVDLFQMGNSYLLLQLNNTVLYHSADIPLDEKEAQFKATESHFYNSKRGGINGLMTWFSLNKSLSIWKMTAGVFTHILSQPQLFIEGNHRTGSLVMSYLLVRAGHGPFVLSVQNAKHFFEPAELIRSRNKRLLLDEYLHLPKQTKKFSKLLKSEQTVQFLSS